MTKLLKSFRLWLSVLLLGSLLGGMPGPVKGQSFEPQCPETCTQGMWYELGPNAFPQGHSQQRGVGRITFIEFHPDFDPAHPARSPHAQTIFAGGALGGLWRSDDEGRHWRNLTPCQLEDQLAVSDLAIHPENPDLMLLATGDPSIPNNMNWGDGLWNAYYYSTGLLRSRDGGQHWEPVPLPAPFGDIPMAPLRKKHRLTMYEVAFHPLRPDTVLLTLCHFHTGRGWVYRSTDRGQTWEIVHDFPGIRKETDPSSGLPRPVHTLEEVNAVIELEFHPTDPEVIYLSGDYPCRSTDGGTTWHPLYGQTGELDLSRTYAPEALMPYHAPWVSYTKLSVCSSPGLADHLYACQLVVQRTDGKPGPSEVRFWASEDRGDSWRLMGSSKQPRGHRLLRQQKKYFAYAVDHHQPQRQYYGMLEVSRTLNGWQDFESFHRPLHHDIHVLETQPRAPGRVYAGTDGGLFAYTPTGDTSETGAWTERNRGLGLSQCYRLSVAQTPELRVATGLQDNTTLHYAGGQWCHIHGASGDGMECAFDPTDPDYVYRLSQRGSVSRCWVDSCARGRCRSADPPGYQRGIWVTPFTIDSSDAHRLYVGYEQLHQADSAGSRSRWRVCSDFPERRKLSHIAVCESRPSVVYVIRGSGADAQGQTRQMLWKTENVLDSLPKWTALDPTTLNLPYPAWAQITALCVHPRDPQTLWLGFDRYTWDSSAEVQHHLWESRDGGRTWTDLSAGLPGVPIHALLVDAVPEPPVLYAATDRGVYRRAVLPRTRKARRRIESTVPEGWQCFSRGMPPFVVIPDLDIHQPTRQLVAATHGRGVWLTPLVPLGKP